MGWLHVAMIVIVLGLFVKSVHCIEETSELSDSDEIAMFFKNGAYVGTAAFMLHAADEGSGVASVEYQVDGGAWLPYTTTVPFTLPLTT